MRRYETTYIIRPNIGEEQFTEVIERTNDIINNDNGAIINLDRWGMKKLAYEIKKEVQGYYVHVDYATQSTNVDEMERIFRIDDRILRYLTIKTAKDIDQETIESEKERIIELANAPTAEEAEAEAEDNNENTDNSDEVATEEVANDEE
ncbi:MAG: 30S ribosomal protein S6 [Desulfobulbaceae bacterium]|nr:30S ribosomal protein S6 [Desulfobulbaceae bacterium]